MMSTAEEGKAEMFGDDTFAGHHESGGGPLLARANRNGFSRRGIPIADDVDKLVGQLVDLAEARLRPSRRLLSRRSAHPRREQQRPEGWRPGQRDNAAAAATALVSS